MEGDDNSSCRLPSLLGGMKLDVLRKYAESAPEGAMMEVGIYMGGSSQVLNEIAKAKNAELWLYDTFEGLPCAEAGLDSHLKGDFSGGMSFDDAEKEFAGANVIKAWFPHDCAIPERIAFVHLDVDQYQCYRESLDALMPRMVSGGVILCDDYCLGGAIKAIDETSGDKEMLDYGQMIFRF